MTKRICTIALAALLASGAAAMAQQFDRNAYKDLVDSSSPDTIAPGTKITVQNWTQYKRFMPTWMQIAYSGKVHFHVGDTPEYAIGVAPTGNYQMPKPMRDDTEKYAGQTKLVPSPDVKPLPSLGQGYCYQQRIFYVDKQTLYPTMIENYDRNDKIYHIEWLIAAPINFKGEQTMITRAFAFSLGMDMQNSHASPDIGYDLKFDKDAPGEYLESGIYTPSGLARVMK